MAGALELALDIEADLIAIEKAMDDAIEALRRRKRNPPPRPGRIRRSNLLTGQIVRVPGSGLGSNTYGREIEVAGGSDD